MWKFILLIACCWIFPNSAQTSLNPSVQSVNNNDVAPGYPLEAYKVTTADRYILTLNRIRESPSSPRRKGKTVVFLMHGILACAQDFLVLGEGKAIAYLLADLGYDVWLGNARGTTLSRSHADPSMSPEGDEFWQFSWEEIGLIDLPAMVDFALNETKTDKMHYIGHSQGCTVFFVMTSEFPEYNKKFLSMHAMAPLVFMTHLFSPLVRVLALNPPFVDYLLSAIGYDEFLPNNNLVVEAGKLICDGGDDLSNVCKIAAFIIFGFDFEQLESSLVPKIMKNTPAGIAAKQFIHYLQLVYTGKFRRFNYYGQNQDVYEALEPPEFDLKRVTTKVYTYYATNDWAASTIDVGRLAKALPNHKATYKVPLGKFNHIDFVWAKDAKKLVYDKLLANLEANN